MIDSGSYAGALNNNLPATNGGDIALLLPPRELGDVSCCHALDISSPADPP